MRTDTMECILSDLLNCGYADIDMLEVIYSRIGDEITDKHLDRSELLKSGDLNDILYQFYETCNFVIREKAEELLQEYKDSLDEENKPTDRTSITELVSDTGMEDIFYPEEFGEFKPLTEEQIETIEKNLEEMENQYPYTNCLDSHYGTDLDQTLDEDLGIFDNAISLIKYWLS